MNTTQNTRRIIATALIAVTAGLALSSCATRQLPEPEIQQAAYRDQAERRADLSHANSYVDQAERRAGLDGGGRGIPIYRDQAERRQSIDGGH